MKLFVYNEKSILNSGIVRVSNGISLGIVGILGVANETEFEFKPRSLLILFSVSTILTIYAINKVIQNIDFFEWDYTERKKKWSFVTKYILVCSILSSLFVLSVYILHFFILDDIPIIGKLLGLLPPLLFGFDILNIVSLFHPFFEQELTLGYKIQKKPENWKDDGKEINKTDEVEEIMHRDFGINP